MIPSACVSYTQVRDDPPDGPLRDLLLLLRRLPSLFKSLPMRQDSSFTDNSRTLPSLLHGDVERPRLLAGLAFGCDEASNSIRAHVVEANRSERIHERIRVLDLAKELWPGANAMDGVCRSLRSLSDTSKQNFLLRVSRRAVWVRTDFVRAVVEPSRVTFLDSSNPTFAAFVEEFRTNTRYRQNEDGFRSWTVECIICAAVTLHSMRLQVMRPVVENMLDNVRSQTFNSLLKLYPLKMALSSFTEQMRPLVHGLRHVLQIDEEMLGVPSASTDTWVSSALEDVLYCWSRTAEELMDEAVQLSVKIEDKMRFEEASMSCTRNQLLRFELWTNVATVAVGLGSLLSGVFGMNLNNHGFDSKAGMFYLVSGIILFGMLVIVWGSLHVIARSLRHYNDYAPRFGNNRFFRRIDDDYYVLTLNASLPDAPGMRLHRLVQELSEKSLPHQGEFGACCRRRPHRTSVVHG